MPLPTYPFGDFNASTVHTRPQTIASWISWGTDSPIPYTLVRKSQVLQLSEAGYATQTDDWYRYSEAEVNAVCEASLGYEDAIVRKKPRAEEAYDAYIAK